MAKENISIIGAPQVQGQQYTLKVNNLNSELQHFCLFQQLPNINGADLNALSLAWMVGSAAAHTGGNTSAAQFLWYVDYTAYTGYLQQMGTASSPRQFSTNDSVSVQVDSQNKLVADYSGSFPNGAPAFAGAPTSGPSGEITIDANNTLPTNSQQQSENMEVNLGIGMNNKPAVTVQLLSDENYQFTPKPTYYILSGQYLEGQVIDTSITTDPYKVVFDGVTTKTLNFTEENTFVPA